MLIEQSPLTALKDLDLKLANEVSIPINSINNLSIDYDIENPYVSGSFEFETDFDLGEMLNFKGESELQLQAKDAFENKINEKFIIFNFTCVRQSFNNYISSGKFVDIVSWEFSKIFISKGFSNCNLKDVISDEQVGKNALEKSTKDQDFDETKKIENFVISGDKNLLSIQNKMKEYFNCVFFQTHNEIKIKTWNNLFRKQILKIKDKEIIFTNPAPNANEFFGILEFQTDSAKGLEISKYGTKVKCFSYNPLERTTKPFEYDLTQANKDLNNLGKIKETSQAVKNIYIAHINPKEQIKYNFQRNLMFNSKIVFLTNGLLNINPGFTINLSFKQYEKNSENLSGQYLITKVTDNIVQGFLTQRIVATRPSPLS